jgi:hypothetical protein
VHRYGKVNRISVHKRVAEQRGKRIKGRETRRVEVDAMEGEEQREGK